MPLTRNLLPPELGLPVDLLRRGPQLLDRNLLQFGQIGRMFGRDVRGRGTPAQWLRACLAANELVANENLNRSLVPAAGSAAYHEWKGGAWVVQNIAAPLSQLPAAHQGQLRQALQQLAAAAMANAPRPDVTALQNVFALPRNFVRTHYNALLPIFEALSPFGPYAHLNPARLAAENPYLFKTNRQITGFQSTNPDPYSDYYAPSRSRLRMGGLLCEEPSESGGDEPYLLTAAAGLDNNAIKAFAASGNYKDLNLAPTLYRMEPVWPFLAGATHSDSTTLVDVPVDAEGIALWAASYALWENDSSDAQKRGDTAKAAGAIAEKVCETIGKSLQSAGNPYAIAAGAAIEYIGKAVKVLCEAFAVLIKLIEHDVPLAGGSFSSSVYYGTPDEAFSSVQSRNFYTSSMEFGYRVMFVEELIGKQKLQSAQAAPVGPVKIPPMPHTFLIPEDKPDGVWAIGGKGDFTWDMEWKGCTDAQARWRVRTINDTKPVQASAWELRRRAYQPGDTRDPEDGGGQVTVHEVYVKLQIHWWYDGKGILAAAGWGNGRCHFVVEPV